MTCLEQPISKLRNQTVTSCKSYKTRQCIMCRRNGYNSLFLRKMTDE